MELRIRDALGRSALANGTDIRFPMEIRGELGLRAVVDSIRELGSSTIPHPSIDGVLFALAVSQTHCTWERDQEHPAALAALHRRNPQISDLLDAKGLESLFGRTESSRAFNFLKDMGSPEAISLDQAKARIAWVAALPIEDRNKIILLAPLCLFGNAELGVRDIALTAVTEIDPLAADIFCGFITNPPF